MNKNVCLYFGKSCDYANEYGDCRIGQQNCNRFGCIITEDDLEDYLDYDLFEEDL